MDNDGAAQDGVHAGQGEELVAHVNLKRRDITSRFWLTYPWEISLGDGTQLYYSYLLPQQDGETSQI